MSDLISVMWFQDLVATVCEEYFQRYRRQTHVTPMSYLSFINGYKGIYGKKKEEIGILADRMNTGMLSCYYTGPICLTVFSGFVNEINPIKSYRADG